MRIAVNIASSYMRYLLGLVAVAFLTPYILATVGVESFGLWALCLALTGVLGLLDLGFSTAAVKYVAECSGDGRVEARNEALTTLFVLYVVMGLAILALLLAVIPASISWFQLTPAEAKQFRTLMTITGSAIAAGLPLSLFRSALVGQGRYDVVNAVDVVVIALNVLLVYLLLESGLGLTGLALANTFMVLAPSLILGPLAFRLIPCLKMGISRFRIARLRQVAPLAFWFMLANIALLLALRSDALLVKVYLPLSAVAAFAIAAKISEFSYLLNKQFSNALMPLISRSHGAGDLEAIRNVLKNGTRLLALVSAPSLLLLFIHAEALIKIWVGPDLLQAVAPLRILLVSVFLSTLQFNAANVLGMLGKHRRVACTLIGSASMNVALTLFLVPRLGLTGAALATLISVATIELNLILGGALAQQGMRAGSILKPILRIAPALGCTALVATWIQSVFPADNLFDLLWQSAVSGAVYLLIAFLTAVKRSERRWILDHFLNGRREHINNRIVAATQRPS
jgi:O-antigen/teichoic acid export membrane protein